VDRRFKGLPPSTAPRSRASTPPAPYAPPLARTNITPNPLVRHSDQPHIEPPAGLRKGAFRWIALNTAAAGITGLVLISG